MEAWCYCAPGRYHAWWCCIGIWDSRVVEVCRVIACDASSKTASALGLTRADQPQAGPRRVLQLDILRGLAVLLVLFRHPAIGAQHARSRTCERIATALYLSLIHISEPTRQ